MKVITDALTTITNLLVELNSKSNTSYLDSKSIWTLAEFCAYSGLKESTVYKLTSGGAIPHYKPNGKNIFFDREEILTWLKRSKVEDNEAIDQQVADLFTSKIDQQ